MKFEELIVLLPCHSLEDFPVYSEGAEAEGLLSAWTAVWHPALLASAKSLPVWHRIDSPPGDLANRLIVVPSGARDRLPAGFVERVKGEGAVLVDRCGTVAEIVQTALAGLDGGAGPFDDEIAADFMALGFCRLQVELLTRQMRYYCNIDDSLFRAAALAAVEAAAVHDTATAHARLGECFNLLYEARKYFYPVDAYLIDLTLMAPTTIGPSLRRELSQASPVNLLITADLLAQLATEQPESLAMLRDAVERGAACLVGGECSERAVPLLPLETIRAEIDRGLGEYERLVGRRPRVFGRRRNGLSPFLPQVLSKLGFRGALHFTLDEGRFPVGTQCKIRWEGTGSFALDSLARLPNDASRPECFLAFPRKMGESMDADHVATVMLAHWPGQASGWYEVLRRVARFTPALGKFVTLDDYFEHSDTPSRISKFEADEYRAPYLQQAIIRNHANPISAFVEEHRRRARRDTIEALSTLIDLLGGSTAACRASANGAVARQPAAGASAAATTAELDRELEDLLQKFAAAALHRAAGNVPGFLAVNPTSFTRRMGVELPAGTALPAVEPPVVAAGESHGRSAAVVEVPPMGFAWVGSGADSAGKKKKSPPLAEGTTLTNEFFRVVVNPKSGAIQSVHDLRHRDNRLSQQIAFRLPGERPVPGETWRDPDEAAVYTAMIADSVEVTSAGPALGEIVARGGLVDASGKRLAEFRQTLQAWAGSRVLQLQIDIDPHEVPRADPWNSYYAARFAWHDASAEMWRGVGLARMQTDAKRLESPHYLELVNGDQRTALLTAGLPYHRRSGLRMVDCLLIVRGESARSFRMGIGVDLAQPAPAALEMLLPPTVVHNPGVAPAGNASGWLFHVDAKNVVATHWEPLADGAGATSAAATPGRIESPATALPTRGFRVRLLETAGRAGAVSLRAFRAVDNARQIDFRGEPISELKIDGDKITFDVAAHEWIEVEAVWKGLGAGD